MILLIFPFISAILLKLCQPEPVYNKPSGKQGSDMGHNYLHIFILALFISVCSTSFSTVFCSDEIQKDTGQLIFEIEQDTLRKPTVEKGVEDSLSVSAGPENPLLLWNELEKRYDRIITKSGDSLVVRVSDINVYEVVFNFPLNTRKERIGKPEIKEVIYADGRKEIFSGNGNNTGSNEKEWAVEVTEKDWERVVIIETPEEASGLSEIGKVSARYEAVKINATTDYMERNVIIILRKRAARMGANVVLILDKKEYRSFGELPSIEIYGVAYMKP